jgi:hypothetical protein
MTVWAITQSNPIGPPDWMRLLTFWHRLGGIIRIVIAIVIRKGNSGAEVLANDSWMNAVDIQMLP